MRTRDEFVGRHYHRWHELDQLLQHNAQLHRANPAVISRVATLYRAVCSDLMHARSMGYGHDLIDYLNSLASKAHNGLYGPRAFSGAAVVAFLLTGFPTTLRRNWRPMTIAALAFTLPLLFGLVATLRDSDFAMNVLPPTTLAEMARAYAEGFDQGRDAGADSAMAGFYVFNNVGIAFRCFATGILFGLGSLFFLVYNGLVIGTTVGYVIASGAGTNILAFICGHGPFELTAIVISGGAGLKMGYSLVETRGLTRIASLRAAAPELVVLIMGAAVMLLIAALIEGYWSPSGFPHTVKWAFSALVSVWLAAYFVFAGRETPRRRPSAASSSRSSVAPPGSGSMPPPSAGSMPPPSVPPPSSRTGLSW
jgi:uncharacterized membrane protein SpoIIM required for sporulation